MPAPRPSSAPPATSPALPVPSRHGCAPSRSRPAAAPSAGTGRGAPRTRPAAHAGRRPAADRRQLAGLHECPRPRPAQRVRHRASNCAARGSLWVASSSAQPARGGSVPAGHQVRQAGAQPARRRRVRAAATSPPRCASSRCSGSSSRSSSAGRASSRASEKSCSCPLDSSCGKRRASAPMPSSASPSVEVRPVLLGSTAEDLDPAGARSQRARRDAQQRRLAAAVRAAQRERLPRVQAQARGRQQGLAAGYQRRPVQAQDRRLARHGPSATRPVFPLRVSGSLGVPLHSGSSPHRPMRCRAKPPSAWRV